MRTLSLRKETLAELTGAELAGVGGGNTGTGLSAEVYCPTDPCITTPVTGLRCLLSLDEACL